MKKVVLTVAILALVGAGVWYGINAVSTTSTAQKTATQTATVTIGSVESVVTAQGTLEPKDYVDVGAQVSGLVKKLHVDIGDDVKSGDLIAEIDPDVYEAQVSGSQARLKTLEADRNQQIALVKQSQQKLERNRQLIKEKAISKEAFEDAQTNVDIAKAKLQSIEAQIEEEKSTLEGNETNLSYTKIYAPMDGTVVSQSTKEGQTINANQTAPVIVQVANLDIMTAQADVAEADIAKIKPGMPVYFTTLGSTDRKWNGTVRQVLPTPTTVNDVVLYNVLVDVENKDHQLMTGMTTQMFFVLGSAEKVPTIPVAALGARVNDADKDGALGYTVNVMTAKGPEPRTVLVSLSSRTTAAISSGLNVSDKVVITSTSITDTTKAKAGGMGRGGMPRI